MVVSSAEVQANDGRPLGALALAVRIAARDMSHVRLVSARLHCGIDTKIVELCVHIQFSQCTQLSWQKYPCAFVL